MALANHSLDGFLSHAQSNRLCYKVGNLDRTNELCVDTFTTRFGRDSTDSLFVRLVVMTPATGSPTPRRLRYNP